MTAEGRVISLRELVTFDDERYAKIDVARSERLLLGMNALRPGQEQQPHAHEDQDKFYLVLEGSGTFTLGETRHEVAAGECVWAPAGVMHGVVNESRDDLVLLVGIAPAPGG